VVVSLLAGQIGLWQSRTIRAPSTVLASPAAIESPDQ
jgi:hypothetical protein